MHPAHSPARFCPPLPPLYTVRHPTCAQTDAPNPRHKPAFPHEFRRRPSKRRPSNLPPRPAGSRHDSVIRRSRPCAAPRSVHPQWRGANRHPTAPAPTGCAQQSPPRRFPCHHTARRTAARPRSAPAAPVRLRQRPTSAAHSPPRRRTDGHAHAAADCPPASAQHSAPSANWRRTASEAAAPARSTTHFWPYF